MNPQSVTDHSKDISEKVDQLEEPWFDETPPSSQRRASAPPIVHVGEFLGDPEVDAWLR